MPPSGRKALDNGVSQQRGVGAVPYKPSSGGTEREFQAILVRPVPAGSDQRRSALVSFLAPMPTVEKGRRTDRRRAPAPRRSGCQPRGRVPRSGLVPLCGAGPGR